MSKIAQMLQAAAGAAGGTQALAIEDVFSTYLYTGNGSTQTITNGIDLAGEGGLVWAKSRSASYNHFWVDTERGGSSALRSDSTTGASTYRQFLSFNSDGYDITSSDSEQNNSGSTYASWTFRKAPRFFDVVTYTGNGVAGRQIPHNLGVTPGMVIIKSTNASYNWECWHNGLTDNTKYIRLNTTEAERDEDDFAGLNLWNQTAPTDSVFTVGTWGGVNGDGITYVAYLFAHDPLGPSGDGSDGLIACGSVSYSGGATVDLGWEPQWVLVKPSSSTGNWILNDNMRGMPATGRGPRLDADTSGAELANAGVVNPTATGFTVPSGIYDPTDLIYIAIRRGPMRQPESGTEVFSVNASSASLGTKITTGFPVDMQISAYRTGTDNKQVLDRMRGVSTNTTGGGRVLYTNTTSSESSDDWASLYFDNTGFQMPELWAGLSTVFYNFSRAPGFFDVVAYTGDGVAGRTVPHNLGVAPELIIVKRRDGVSSWITYWESLGATKGVFIDTNAPFTSNTYWNDTAPTDSVFSLGSGSTNTSSATFISYLFATVPGVSKVGSYTGNGTSQTIDCGFTSGARFVLIKRTDTTGSWHLWDTERGINVGNDPVLRLNLTIAEDSGHDAIDPDSSGFIVNQEVNSNPNVSGSTYIFLAIA